MARLVRHRWSTEEAPDARGAEEEITMATERQVVTKLRKFCLPLPEVRETKTYGHPTFQAGKKTFVVIEEYHGDN